MFAINNQAEGVVFLPDSKVLETLRLNKKGNKFVISNNPLQGKVSWKIRKYKK